METIWNFAIKDMWDFENGYYLTSHPSRLAKAIAHWELYKKITSIPGEIVECGVFKGASSIRFATYREITESAFSRKLIGFDMFGAFPSSSLPEDSAFIHSFEESSGTGIPCRELNNCFAYKGFQNYEFIQGDICQTVPHYISKHKELKIALLHIDVDVYDPAKTILEQLFDHVVPGGIIVLDDYGTVYGETKAVDDYLQKQSKAYAIQKLPFYKIPAYIQK